MLRCQYYIVDKKNSGVGVLDKAVKILACLEAGPHSLSELVAATGIARPTAHRLAVALEYHRMVSRDYSGRFVLGLRSSELASAAGEDRLLAVAGAALSALRMRPVRVLSYIGAKVTNESASLLQNAYLDFEIRCQLEQC